MAKSILFAKEIPINFWMETVYIAMYLINKSPTSVLKNQTPFVAWNGWKSIIKHLKVFGCLCYAQVSMEEAQVGGNK